MKCATHCVCLLLLAAVMTMPSFAHEAGDAKDRMAATAKSNDEVRVAGEGSGASFDCYEVSVVVPESTPKLGEPLRLSVHGHCLPSSLVMWIAECRGMAKLPGGTSEKVEFTCTPDYSTGDKLGKVKPYSGAPDVFLFTITVQQP